ncbi:hypothetical protein A2755_01240 [Candidatus Wolfebacteria bacterium RIFCSPHIGHO2_01_FULL_48_22]|uniref:50S ribosomal protein L35 n=2 Tax=Candidatus Wolfeibacteriota TaxID=1752735 RepID=A0A1F8DUU9_9BACT|nr:MAG: hypothetical protein A2755_01240 [Candidatus Wolfebacteria bacterium RIFCSPHIGHO2_01_FULL_48_22]OGM93921.1 MAG: hypothetical protein A2935_03555 [Candidatus Wolfebacteria bacterium RIFCSPLOWO2_01_FULL_47_17b]
MKKAVTTRLKVTKNGKVLVRKQAQCHFRAKKTGQQLMRKSRTIEASAGIAHKYFNKKDQF